jgi:hypothetical protein
VWCVVPNSGRGKVNPRWQGMEDKIDKEGRREGEGEKEGGVDKRERMRMRMRMTSKKPPSSQVPSR